MGFICCKEGKETLVSGKLLLFGIFERDKLNIMAIHHIRLEDLNETFIKKLQAEYQKEGVEVLLEVRTISKNDLLSEEEFWRVIETIDGNKEEEEAILPTIKYLADLPIAHIYQFEDLLAKKLFALDTQEHAEHCGENAYKGQKHFSADLFLYARCFVVAQGKVEYHKILTQPDHMPKDQTFEPLLNLASKAYKKKTGKLFDYVPSTIYETFNNTEGWNNQGLVEKILFG